MSRKTLVLALSIAALSATSALAQDHAHGPAHAAAAVVAPEATDAAAAVDAFHAALKAGDTAGAVNRLTTETMVLKRHADGWRIHHIHWSSRAPG